MLLALLINKQLTEGQAGQQLVPPGAAQLSQGGLHGWGRWGLGASPGHSPPAPFQVWAYWEANHRVTAQGAQPGFAPAGPKIKKSPCLGRQLQGCRQAGSPQLSPRSPLSSVRQHIVCHSDRFKQTRLGLIRLRLRFLQRFAGARLQKAVGRQQTGGQAPAGRDWLSREKWGEESKRGSLQNPPNPCPSAITASAGCCPGWLGRGGCGRLCSVAGAGTRRLLPPRAWRAAPTHTPFLPKSPQKMGPKVPRGRWDPPGGRAGSCQQGEKQATTSK